MKYRLLAGALAALAFFHREPELKRMLRGLADEFRELDGAGPKRRAAQPTSRR